MDVNGHRIGGVGRLREYGGGEHLTRYGRAGGAVKISEQGGLALAEVYGIAPLRHHRVEVGTRHKSGLPLFFLGQQRA